ncbi:MAG: hypothetical protein ACJ8D6_04035 [Sphingomicrobium sp.]
MAKMSLSKAWDETRTVLGREGKLFAAVALAMIFLPGVIVGVVEPEQTPATIMAGGTTTWLILLTALIGLVGQLAMIRLALGPATSVRDAIAHGARRMPFYFAATMIWIVPLVVALLLFGKVFEAKPQEASGAQLLAVCIIVVALLYLVVRLILISAVASAEAVGPIGMLKRAWVLSKGHWWRLFGFVLLFGLAAVVLLGAVGAISGIVAGLLFGAAEPMSVAALFVALFTELASALVTTVFIVMIARLYAQASGLSSVSVPASGS